MRYQGRGARRKDELDPNSAKSEIVSQELLAKADKPRPDDMRKILEDLLFKAGIIPSLEAGVFSPAILILTGLRKGVFRSRKDPIHLPIGIERNNPSWSCLDVALCVPLRSLRLCVEYTQPFNGKGV